jgi:hypothetical protein
MQFRSYDESRDREAVQRVWRETGWLTPGKEDVLDLAIRCGHCDVAEVDGEAECVVMTAPGTVMHRTTELPMSCVTAVTTSHVARRLGMAGRLTAQAVARDAAAGALVASLGMFEQGFYDRLGFGSGSYERYIAFDPRRLKVKPLERRPRRLTIDDWQRVHAGRLARWRWHGACNITAPEFTRHEMLVSGHHFGLGFGEGDELSHHIWCHSREVTEFGPYKVRWMAWQTTEQFHELMAVLKSFGDQIKVIKMYEPPGIQFQDLLDRPLDSFTVSRGSEFEQRNWSLAEWQMRICDVPGCLSRTRVRGDEFRFNLRLSDPIERFLDAGAPWRGVAGDYVVTLGPMSGAESGGDPSLPVLETTVNAFTRLWLGVCPASGLAITDQFCAPASLVEQLDEVLCLPSPKPDWRF